MSKVFTSKEFIKKLEWLTTIPNIYHSGAGWSTLKNGKWRFDCVLSVKCILWGFKADKNKFRGGTVYKSNGVPDFPCNAVNEICTDVGTKFDKLVPGEYLCMKGTKYNHTGIYLGDGRVFEDTTGWKANRAIISKIDKNGVRSYKGVKNLRWTYHGKLKYIDYTDEPVKKEYKYQSHDMKKDKWLPEVKIGSADYAGNPGEKTDAFKVENAAIKAHDNKKGYWLPEVKSYKEYAGNYGNAIDGIAIKSLDPNIKLEYRVQIAKNKKWLPWVSGYDTKDSKNGYAGNIGEPICCIQIREKK